MGERLSDAEEVGGSKPPEPTIASRASAGGAPAPRRPAARTSLAVELDDELLGDRDLVEAGRMVVAALLRGLYRGFPWIFAYIVALFLSTVVEIPVNFAYYTGDRQAFRSRAWTYWLNEAILLPLIAWDAARAEDG